MSTTLTAIPYKIVAEWTERCDKCEGGMEYHFILRTHCHSSAKQVITDLATEFGPPGSHGGKWYWDSANDHGTLSETTMSVVFTDYEDTVLFKLSQD